MKQHVVCRVDEIKKGHMKAFTVAFSKGSWNNGSSRWVLLLDMQGTTVDRNLPPTGPFVITPEDRTLFMRQLTAYAALSGRHQAPVTHTASVLNPLVDLDLPGIQNSINNLNTITLPPKLVPHVQVLPPPPEPPPTPHPSPHPSPPTHLLVH